MIRAVVAFLFIAAWFCGVPAANGQSFEVASVKPSTSGESIACSGGAGTADPELWRCSNIPLGIVVSKAFRFQDYQFSTHDPCCLERFDFVVRVPAGTTNEQFDRMLQNLLKERFKLVFHLQQKEMSVYELTVASNGPKMKQKPPETARESEPWWIFSGSTKGLDKDGYPVFSEGGSGLAGSAGHFRWTAFGVSTADIAKTLSDQSNRPVVDATGLKGMYDVDLKWTVDLNFTLSERGKAEIREMVGELPDSGGGPTLVRAVQDQLGLKLNSTRGTGEIVVVDHVEKVPTAN
jgi:uncharacterized protein (TIGR03435 family)